MTDKMTEKEQKNLQRAPLHTYFKAEGFMQRKPYMMVIFSLFAFTILTQIFVVQNLAKAGVNVKELDIIPMPLWANIVLFLVTVAAIPAIIMRARDAAWPPVAFAGLFGLNIFMGVLQNFVGLTLPNAMTFVIGGLTFISLIALAAKPTN